MSTGSRETSVAETVVCAWNTYPFRHGLKLRAAYVGNTLNVRSQIRQCLSS